MVDQTMVDQTMVFRKNCHEIEIFSLTILESNVTNVYDASMSQTLVSKREPNCILLPSLI